MDNIIGTFSSPSSSTRRQTGFTLVELMVAIFVVAILSAIALPNLNQFLVETRVDNEISEMQRLLLTARNMAINTGQNTTVCPLSSGSCTTNWGNEISVFINDSNSSNNDKYNSLTEELLKTKDAINTGDKLQFAYSAIVYTPSGQIATPTAASTFSYCPKDKADLSRGISVSLSGRSYISSDIDNDGKDEDRSGNAIVCT